MYNKQHTETLIGITLVSVTILALLEQMTYSSMHKGVMHAQCNRHTIKMLRMLYWLWHNCIWCNIS